MPLDQPATDADEAVDSDLGRPVMAAPPSMPDDPGRDYQGSGTRPEAEPPPAATAQSEPPRMVL